MGVSVAPAITPTCRRIVPIGGSRTLRIGNRIWSAVAGARRTPCGWRGEESMRERIAPARSWRRRWADPRLSPEQGPRRRATVSRTDKTRPFWVRVGDPFNRPFVHVVHDHRSQVAGTCEPAACFQGEGCYWRPNWANRYGELVASNCGSRCSCRIKSGEGTVRMNLMRLRRESHKTAAGDIEDLDQLSYDDSFNSRRHRY